jgi:hypothetical protein
LFVFGLGRSAGALLATLFYTRFGFPAVALAAAVFNLLAIVALAEMQGKIALIPRLVQWMKGIGHKTQETRM